MRLHTLIYATTLGVPAVALSYDPKVTAFMQSINQPLCLDVNDFNAEDMKKMLDELCERLPEIKESLGASLSELRSKAKENAELAIDLLNK
jgi:polysaccharide pyruvyl transferase WcaK-like protein